MDCASEEQLIRMKLSGLEQIKHLFFDLGQRRLVIYHEGKHEPITTAIESLSLGGSREATIDEAVVPHSPEDLQQKKLLWTVLIINFSLFALEMVTGFISNSMGLVADSLDMLADAVVYGLALLVVGSSATRKGNVAKFSGYLQLLLAVLGLLEVVRRFIGHGEVPVFQTMIIISLLALAGNGVSLYLLQKSKSSEAHMRASMIFTSNDVVVNLGVIAAGILVFWTNSKLPDLIVGVIVFVIVGRGAFRILKLR